MSPVRALQQQPSSALHCSRKGVHPLRSGLLQRERSRERAPLVQIWQGWAEWCRRHFRTVSWECTIPLSCKTQPTYLQLQHSLSHLHHIACGHQTKMCSCCHIASYVCLHLFNSIQTMLVHVYSMAIPW